MCSSRARAETWLAPGSRLERALGVAGRVGRRLAAVAALSLAAGCAMVPTAEVTVFHDWSDTAAERRFEFQDPEPDSLEQRTYREIVEQAFATIGFRREPGAPLRMKLRVEEREIVRQQVEHVPGPAVGFGWFGAGRTGLALGWGWPGPWYPWWPQPYWAPGYWDPGWVPVERDLRVYENRLSVELRERRDGSERLVYEATAVTETLERALPQAVRLLAEAIVRDFPGAHGVVRRVNLPARSVRSVR